MRRPRCADLSRVFGETVSSFCAGVMRARAGISAAVICQWLRPLGVGAVGSDPVFIAVSDGVAVLLTREGRTGARRPMDSDIAGQNAVCARRQRRVSASVNASTSSTVTVSAECPLRLSGDGTFSRKWIHTPA